MDSWENSLSVDEQIDAWQQEMVAVETEITRLRARQVELIRKLDRFQVDTACGARTLGDWTAAQLDVSHQTASRLTQLATAADTEIDGEMAAGRWGLDRAAILAKLRTVGLPEDQFAEAAAEYSLGRLYGLLDRLRHLDPVAEADVFASRYLVIQPNLDESMFKLWGQLPGVDGQIVEQALSRREGDLPVLPDQWQGQRRADALTSLCLDSLTANSGEKEDGGGEPGRAVTVADIFLDGELAAASFGEQGATMSSGPRVGPNTLEEILCNGQIRVIVTDRLRPVAYSDLGEAIRPAVRSYVLWRDQGQCSIEGCRSRYRLQPHHITQRAFGGSHDPENLISLCWYHHHVAIHQMGMRIDPDTPTHRRRLLPPPGTAPPGPVITQHLRTATPTNTAALTAAGHPQ